MTPKTKTPDLARDFPEKSVQRAFDLSSAYAVCDEHGRFLSTSPGFCRLTGYSFAELRGQTPSLFHSGTHSPEYFKPLWQDILDGRSWSGEVCNRNKDGGLFWVDQSVIPVPDPDSGETFFAVTWQEITKQKELEGMLSSLPQQLIEAQELERDRISREIHDDLGQSLATFKMLLQTTLNMSSREALSAGRQYEKIINYLNAIIEKSRNLSSVLRPSTLEVLGLTAALKALVEDCRNNSGLDIRSRIGDLDEVILRGEAIHLYRIVQEALTNIIHHAGATEVTVAFFRGEGYLTVNIRDNGKGFDPARDRGDPYGLGLSTMRERCKNLQGSLRILSSPDQGTAVKVKIPLGRKG